MNAFAMFTPGHLSPGTSPFPQTSPNPTHQKQKANTPNKGQWRHPEDQAGDYTNLAYWTKLAKVLEEGKFHGLFLADVLGIYDVYKGPGNPVPALEAGSQFPIGDPL